MGIKALLHLVLLLQLLENGGELKERQKDKRKEEPIAANFQWRVQLKHLRYQNPIFYLSIDPLLGFELLKK